MKTKLVLSMLVILVAIVAAVGGTFAWFTAEEEVTNTFTAGTVLFDLDEEMTSDSAIDETNELHAPNVNPGDCYKKDITIENEGTKYILLRMDFEELWLFDKSFLVDNYESLGFTEDEKSGLEEKETGEDGKLTWDQVEDVFTDLENPVIWEDIMDNDNVDKEGIDTQLEEADWIYDTDTEYWYYENALDGAFGDSPDTISFDFELCFDGEKMNNVFQKSDYSLTIGVQAIQASNNASGDAWEVDSWYYDESDDAVEPNTEDLDRSAENWAEFDPAIKID